MQNVSRNSNSRYYILGQLTKSRQFTVKSMYEALKASQVKAPYRKVWFLKTPLKVSLSLVGFSEKHFN